MKIKKIEIKKPELSFPDVDTDFGVNLETGMGREDVINYLIDKYGRDYVAMVGNRLTYAGKSVLRDLGQVYNIPSKDTQEASKEYNNELNVEENILNSKVVKEYFEKYPELKDKVDRISGTVSALGIHAGGVVLADAKRGYSLRKWCALQRSKEGERIATNWTKKEVEQIGLIKYDILGLSSASQIYYAQKISGLEVYKDFPEYDEVFEDVVLNLKHKNIFQFETQIGRQAFDDLKPMSIMEIANASGLIRVLGSDAGRSVYNTYKENIEYLQQGDENYWKEKLREQIYEDKNYEVCVKYLNESYGVLIYQEQLANLVMGFSDGEKSFIDGDKKVRKMLDKLGDTGHISNMQGNVEAMKKWHGTFMEIMNEYVLPYIGDDGWTCPDKAVQAFLHFKLDKDNFIPIPKYGIISWMISAAAYLFSKLHAIAYSTNTYNMMYLKHFHPLEFWTASLICEQSDLKKVTSYINAIEIEEDIKILPPSINKSDYNFKMEKGSIRYGLSAILNLGKSAEIIINERNENGIYESVTDFLNRVPKRIVNKRVVENLMYVDAFNEFGTLEEVYTEISNNGIELDEPEYYDKEALGTIEMKLMGVNLKYKHPLLKTAHNYFPLDQLDNNETAMIAVRILTVSRKLTKKNKPYIMGRVQCLNSNMVANIFDWGNGENFEMKNNMITTLNIKKSGDFFTLIMDGRKR
ncbi:MAG: DNA polymerase III subunit alpha [candidate division CPR1 bacterium ADurb.Bin160]|uniref:DNA-directed DNA polymerase n=1 Tax=candidate division CPR1 bacterium ADurb.Bin160 TaxID=1852826 RepID=A0A1V5ZJF0_9BACT|nr:MAG: DNA polymerase III subunit alpha [candidate division CPR1 bacterium ADurb.Bin160]